MRVGHEKAAVKQKELVQTLDRHEEWFDLRADGLSQYFMSSWYPVVDGKRVQPKAAIVFIHGFGEFVERYDIPFRHFAKNGFMVSGFDQRGYGRTWYYQPDPDQTHGWTTWQDQFVDVSHKIELTRTRLDELYGKDVVPIFLMGHSMGGGISAGFVTRDAGAGPTEKALSMVSGVMLSAPWLDIFFPIPLAIRTFVMRTMLAIFPRLRIPLGPAAKELSRDPQVIETIRSEPMHNNYVYTRGLFDPMSSGPKIVSQDYVKWPERVPLIVIHGTGDKVTRADCSEKLVENLKSIDRDAEYVPMEGYYHELMHEPGDDKIKVVDTYIEWLNRHLSK
ncbi:acylglycerol lipase [Malassezia cuniculi]|uniref:Acylglycerol lipase n=1 Tax=Malassezia cuniculi TaxID=948313 RepID=A0AAF0EVP6_9BASI|nr:acylglycerol lipase [Malassezia cuniculi]